MSEIVLNPAGIPPSAKTALADIETTPITYDSGGCMIIPSTVWMLVANDYERDISYVWVGHENVEAGVRWLETCDEVVFHFGRGFDERVLRHHYGFKKRCKDSVVLLRMLYSNQTEEDKIAVKARKDRKEAVTRFTFTGDLVGKHSLEAWGLRLKPVCPKGTYMEDCKATGKEPFMQYDALMHEYGIQDVRVLRRIWAEKILPKLQEKGDNLTAAIVVEHYMADLMEKLKITGIKFNKMAAMKLAQDLERRAEEMVVQLKKDFRPRLEPIKWVFIPLESNDASLEVIAQAEIEADVRAALEMEGGLEMIFSQMDRGEYEQEGAADKEEEDDDDTPSKFKKTNKPHRLPTLARKFPKNKVYRPQFGVESKDVANWKKSDCVPGLSWFVDGHAVSPETKTYQREMWGEISCPAVNRTVKDKDGNVTAVISKYTGETRFEEKVVKKGPNAGKKQRGKLIYPDHDGEGMTGENSFCKVHMQDFNPKSRPQLVRRLLEMGWKPDEFTEAGNPVTDEPTLQKIEERFGHIHGAKNLAHYLMIEKRIGMIKTGKKAWLKLVDDTDFIHPTIIRCAAVTMRATHSDPNISQVPSVKKVKEIGLDGKPVVIKKTNKFTGIEEEEAKLIVGKGEAGKWNWDCRALFTVPNGFSMVGVDLEGIELRCWAHYQWPYDDGYLAEQILHQDIHENNRKILGFNDRTTAKRWLFAMLYGGGDEQLGWIIAPTASQVDQIVKGKESKRRFMSGVRGFDVMKSQLELSVRKRGWLRGIDGRRVPIRKPHAALNTELQSCGAIISKYWIRKAIQLNEAAPYNFKWSRTGYDESDYTLLLYSHDETQYAARMREVGPDQRDYAQQQFTAYSKKMTENASDKIKEEFFDQWKGVKFDTVPDIVALNACLAANWAGEHLKMRIPIAAKATYRFDDGAFMKHWGDTH